jgi:hypothetical protein
VAPTIPWLRLNLATVSLGAKMSLVSAEQRAVIKFPSTSPLNWPILTNTIDLIFKALAQVELTLPSLMTLVGCLSAVKAGMDNLVSELSLMNTHLTM